MTLETINKIVRIPIKDIVIENRYRTEFGDIDGLANDIKTVKLLVPITVTYNPITKKYKLIDGQRRILAYQLLGRTEIDCYVIDLQEVARGEFSANHYHKNWTYSEFYAITEDLEPIFREEAKDRQRQAGKLYGRGKSNNEIASGNFPTAISNNNSNNNKGRALDNLAKQLDIDRKTLNKIKKVGDAAKEQPDKYQPLFKEVDSKKKSLDEAVGIIEKDKKREKFKLENPPVELPENRYLLINDDFTKVSRETIKQFAGKRNIAIITDPPYLRENLPIFEQLAKKADEILEDGESLIFYVGHIILDEVIKIFSKFPNFRYWWLFCVQNSGPTASVHPRKVFAKFKPMLWYVKGNRGPVNQIDYIPDLIKSSPPDKSTHIWAQSLDEFSHIIKYLTVENQVVIDPFMGDATSLVAAAQLDRIVCGVEIDKERYENGLKKIKKSLLEMNEANGDTTKND